jgi:hypothetical protein
MALAPATSKVAGVNQPPKPPPLQQLELPLSERPRRGLRVLKGGGERRQEKLGSRDAVVRVLVGAGADLLLRRISVERAEEIQNEVDAILGLFDRVDATPALMPVLQRRLEELEAMVAPQSSDRRRWRSL